MVNQGRRAFELFRTTVRPNGRGGPADESRPAYFIDHCESFLYISWKSFQSFLLNPPRGHAMSTIRCFVTLFPALTLVFLVGCSTMTPHEKPEPAVEKKAPPKVVLPAETKEKAQPDKGPKE